MKGLLSMTDNSCNKLQRQYIFLKKEILLINDYGSSVWCRANIELKSLILIMLHSDLVVRAVRYVRVISN